MGSEHSPPYILFILLLCSAFLRPSPSRAGPVHPPFTLPPPSSGLRRVLLSIALGVLAGLILALLVAAATRYLFHLTHSHYLLRPTSSSSSSITTSAAALFSPQIDPKSLHLALSTHSHLLGSSPNGTYHRTTLDNGLTLAVKRLQPRVPIRPPAVSMKRLQHELQVLSGLRHRHLMSLREFVSEPDGGFLLVYDYMPAGSLRDAMERVRKNQMRLGWDMRLRIAVGIVKGLTFLHFDCVPRVLHRDLKPSNVMLDAQFEARVADCGLGRVMPKLNDCGSSGMVSDGYRAPESCQNSCRYTDKSDVYSFGVILAMLLTGREPTDPLFGEAGNGGSMVRWLRQLQQAGEARRALDEDLLLGIGEGGAEEEEEMLMALRIAGVCMSDFPADRPSSDELFPMLSQLHSF